MEIYQLISGLMRWKICKYYTYFTVKGLPSCSQGWRVSGLKLWRLNYTNRRGQQFSNSQIVAWHTFI